MFSDYLRRGSATNKFFSILFSIVLVIGLMPVTALGTEGEALDQQEAQTASTQATSTSSMDVSSSDTEATVGGETEQDSEATQASDTEASSDVDGESGVAAPVAAATEAGIAPMSEEGESGISPQATGVHFTKLELHEGSSSGTLVADLLTTSDINWAVGAEYYLVVEVAKDNVADDCWVAIDIPYWMKPINMVGGTSWKTPGAAVDHTSIDQVVDFTAATGASPVAPSSAGKVYYHIKDSVDTCGFQVSMAPTSSYYNGSTAQKVTTEKLTLSCGDMAAGAVGDVADTQAVNSITKTGSKYTGYWQFSSAPTLVTDQVGGSTAYFNTSGNYWTDGAQSVMTDMSFDITYPKGATLKNATNMTFGTPVDNGNDTFTVRCTRSWSGGFVSPVMTINASFDSSVPDGTYWFPVTNISSNTYGDENAYERTSAILTGLQNCRFGFVVKNTLDVKFSPQSGSRYDWLGEQGIEEASLISAYNLAASGSATLKTDPLTVEETFPDNSIVRFFVIPKGADASDTIEINGTSYSTDLAYKTQNWPASLVFRAQDLGLESIKSVKYDIGTLAGGYTTLPVNSYDYYYRGLSAYGSFADGTPVVSEAKVYKTGEGPTDPDLKSTNSTWNPVKDLTTLQAESSIGLSSSNLTAGESTRVTAYARHHGNTSNTTTTCDLVNPVFYLYVPEGFNYADPTINDMPVVGEDVTAQGQNVPAGTKILKFTCPTETRVGAFQSDATYPIAKFEYTLLTEKSAIAGTYNISDFMAIGNDDYPLSYVAAQSGLAKPDQYSINDGRGMGAFPQTLLKVQELKAVTIDNSMTVTQNGIPLNEELVYNASNPNETRAFVKNGYTADYKVHIQNQTGENAKELSVFIPVAKAGQNFGEAFNPDGDQEFDITMVADSIPSGWEVHYLKMNPGVSYATGSAPAAGDYSETTNPAEATMILIKGPSQLADKDGADFTFKVTSNDLSQVSGAIDTWNCVPSYTLGTTLFVPAGYPEALEVATGVVTGRVYNDVNGNGVQDAGELGIPSVTVTSTDNFTVNGEDYPRTQTATTDANGDYAFDYVRNTSATGKNANTEVAITVINPDTHKVFTSHEEGSGNKPSIVTADADQSKASYTGIQLTNGATSKEVDAGLTQLVVKYLGGDHPSTTTGVDWTIDEHNTDVVFGHAWPAYAGPVDTTATNSKNVGKPAAALGYHFDRWNPATTGTVDGSKDFTAQWAKNQYTVTYAAAANGSIEHNATETVEFEGTPTMKNGADDIAAAADEDYYFSGWTYVITKDDNSTVTGTCQDPKTVTITGDAVFTAHFLPELAVVYTVGDHGTFTEGVADKTTFDSLQDGDAWPAYDGDKDTASTNNKNVGNPKGELGYHFTGWNDAATGNPFTIPATVDDNYTLEAQWEANTYTVTFVTNDAAKGTVAGTGTTQTGVAYNTNASVANVTATPATGYKFDNAGKNWHYTITKDDGTKVEGDTDTPASIAILGDTVFKANFTAGYTVDAQNVTMTSEAAKAAFGSSTDKKDLAGANYNNATAKTAGAATTNIGQTLADADWAAIKAGTEGAYNVTYANKDDASGATTKTVTVKISNDGPGESDVYTVNAFDVTLTPTAAINAFGASTDKMDLADPLYNNATATTNGAATTNIGQVVSDADWAKIKAGTEGSYLVKYTNDDDATGATAKYVVVKISNDPVPGVYTVDAKDVGMSSAAAIAAFGASTDSMDLADPAYNDATATTQGAATTNIGQVIDPADWAAIQAGTEGSYNVTYSNDDDPAGATKKIVAVTIKNGPIGDKYTIDAVDVYFTSSAAKALLGSATDATALMDAAYNDATATTNGAATTNIGQVIDPADWAAIQAGTEGTYFVTYTNDDDPAGATAKTVVVKIGANPEGKYAVAAQDAYLSPAGAVAAFGTSTDKMDLAKPLYNNASATTDGAPGTLGQTVADADWAKIQAGSEGTYPVLYANTDDPNGIAKKYVAVVISTDPVPGVYTVDAKDVLISSKDAIAAFGTSTDSMDLAAADYNNAVATSNGAATTNIGQVIDSADWAAIQAGTPGLYQVSYSNDDDPDGATIKTVTVRVVSGKVVGQITANDFEYKTGADQPTITDEKAIELAKTEAFKDNVKLGDDKIAVDATELAAINAAKDAGLKGPYPLTFTNTVTGDKITITVSLKGDDIPPVPGKDTIASTPARYGAVDGDTGIENPDLSDRDVLNLTQVIARNDRGAQYDNDNDAFIVDAADLAAFNAAKQALAAGDKDKAGTYTIKVTTPGTTYADGTVSEPVEGEVTIELFGKGLVPFNEPNIVANDFSHAVSDGLLTDDQFKDFSGVVATDKYGNDASDTEVQIDATQKQVINDAIAAGQTGVFPLTFSWTDPEGTLVTTTIDVTLTGASDITVTKKADVENPKPGDSVTYTLTVTNNGTATSKTVWVKDVVPANTTFVSCDATGVAAADKSYVNWMPTGIRAGESVELTLVVKVNDGVADGTKITNVAPWEEVDDPTTIDPAATPQGSTSNAVTVTVSNPVVVKALSKNYASAKSAKTGDNALPFALALGGIVAAGCVAFVARRRRDDSK